MKAWVGPGGNLGAPHAAMAMGLGAIDALPAWSLRRAASVDGSAPRMPDLDSLFDDGVALERSGLGPPRPRALVRGLARWRERAAGPAIERLP